MQTQKETPTSRDDLAAEIAKTFQEAHRTELYRYVFQKHDESTIRKAFEETTKVPVSRIRKSKSALFFFLLNKYAEK